MILLKIYIINRKIIRLNVKPLQQQIDQDHLVIIDSLAQNRSFLKYFLNQRLSTPKEKLREMVAAMFMFRHLKPSMSLKAVIYSFFMKYKITKKILIFVLESLINLITIVKFDFEYNLSTLIVIFYLTTSFLIKKYKLRFGVVFYVFFPVFILINFQIYQFGLFEDPFYQEFLNKVLLRSSTVEKRFFYYSMNILIFLLQKVYIDYLEEKQLNLENKKLSDEE